MIALYNSLLSAGLVPHVAWRAAFAIVPVPILLTVATAVMIFGTDHPAGKWSDRHKAIAHNPESVHVPEDVEEHFPTKENEGDLEKKGGLADVQVTVTPVSELDYAVSEPLTLALTWKIVSRPLTWLPALSYFTTFGYELAIDANLANILLSLYKSKEFGQTKAGYVSGTPHLSCRF